MSVVARFQFRLSGWQGGPGVNTFHALGLGGLEPDGESLQDFASELRAMYETLKHYLANNLTVSMEPDVSLYDDATGSLVDVHTLTPPAQVIGTGLVATISRATMVKHRYRTDLVHNDRLVRGGVFFGPCGEPALAGDGSVSSACRAAIPGAYEGLLDIAGATRLAVWSQPVRVDGNVTDEGRAGYVQTVSSMPLPAVLRSRRD